MQDNWANILGGVMNVSVDLKKQIDQIQPMLKQMEDNPNDLPPEIMKLLNEQNANIVNAKSDLTKAIQVVKDIKI